MRQVKLQNKLTKVTRPATNDEPARLGMKKSQDYKDRPKTMATKSMSQIPTKDLPSKLNAAVEKAKSYNVPFGSGSGPKQGATKPSSSYKSNK
jgi:hypothetical protein